MESRRNFISKGLLTLGATALGGSSLFANSLAKGPGKIVVQQNDIILFQGDSITDAGRNKESLDANKSQALGTGYAMLAASSLLSRFADKHIQVYNRGISGNRVPDLQQRWQQDCIALQPTILSIMIGVNDFWRTQDRGAINSPALFKSQYQQLLDQTHKSLPGVKLIIAEPFAVRNVKHVTDAWYPEFPAYQEVTKEIAKEFNAVFVPYQQAFNKAEKKAPGNYWTSDGVHTSLAGANLMAETWLEYIK